MKQWTSREFIKLLEFNGYYYKKHSGSHSIFSNKAGRHISVPQSMKCVIIRRLIKEHNLKWNTKSKFKECVLETTP